MDGSASDWRAWLATFFISILATLGLLLASLIVIDPYATGRFTPIKRTTIAADQPMFANVARVRDRQFNAAIIGNSRMMRLSPSELDQLTGVRFVSLAMPGIGPAEQIALVSSFARHHTEQITIVWGLSEEWCPSEPPKTPFPFWLYDETRIAYFRNLLKPSAIELAVDRAKILLGLSRSDAPANGYEQNHPYWMKNTRPDKNMSKAVNGEPLNAPMPAVAELDQVVSTLEKRVRLIFVIPPIFASALPALGSAAEVRSNECRGRLRKIANRLGAPLLDLLQETETTRDPANFVDPGHYRDNIAREIERAVAPLVAISHH